MRISWPGKQCILCLDEKPLTDEHIIPKSLGGKLTCAFLCKNCNSTLGARVEAPAKTDPSIRIAVQHLEQSIPELANRIHEGQDFLSNGPGGKQRGKVKDGQFHVRSQTARDGTLTQPTNLGRKSIEKILRKSGAADAPLAETLKRFDTSPDNQKVSLGPGLEAIKWSVERIEPDLSKSVFLTQLVPLKIAYEFLACHLGAAICDEHPPLTEIRQVLREGAENHPCYSVDLLNASEYKLLHGLVFEGNDPYAKFQIRLFGYLAFRVHLHHLAIAGPRFVYTDMLDLGEEDVSIVEEA